jgi:hypothetical protein
MWQLGDGTTPFIAPALAGLPMVDGLPEYEDIGWAAVGWAIRNVSCPAGMKSQRRIWTPQFTRHEGIVSANRSF